MSRKKIIKLGIIGAALLSIIILAGYYVDYLKKNIPARLYVKAYSDDSIELDMPFVGVLKSQDENVTPASVNFMEPVYIDSGNVEKEEFDVKLFGLFKIKTITVCVEADKAVLAGGTPIGIYIETDGIMVVDTGQVQNKSGLYNSPAGGILKAGDYILAVNNENVKTTSMLIDKIERYGDSAENFLIRRGDELLNVKITPVMDTDGKYKIGTWVKDDCQGLGTLTYVDSKGRFGTLGHAISDSSTGEIVKLDKGKIYTARIWSIVKGKKGMPGEIVGSINYNADNYLGDIDNNSMLGVYGVVNDNIYNYIENNSFTVAYKQDIKTGPAKLLSAISGDLKSYDINITDVDFSDARKNKGITFEVEDESLIELTGGIVQGMSGSPIIQNGHIIGAVTHVLVDSPQMGYGIFIENMLSQ